VQRRRKVRPEQDGHRDHAADLGNSCGARRDILDLSDLRVMPAT
jgi:hypothetical protein